MDHGGSALRPGRALELRHLPRLRHRSPDPQLHAERDNALEDGETRPAGKSNGVYSGAFEPVANLMARVEVPTGKRTRADRILGFAIRCGGMSDLVWHETCVIAQGKLRGMIVSAAAGDNEREMFHFEFDRLDPDARLDGRPFETGREWRAGD